MKTAENEAENVGTHRNRSMTQNSPNEPKIEPPKSTYCWRRTNDDINVYTYVNTPVEVLGTPSRLIVFG